MAILKTALEESLLSKSEQAALRVLARVQQLTEGLNVIQKLNDERLKQACVAYPAIQPKAKEFEQFLISAINNSLQQHRLPALQTPEVKPQISP